MRKNEMIDDITECIRKRTNIAEKLLSVDSLLKVNGMETYATLCKNRIKRSSHCNADDVLIDGTDGEMYLTAIGIKNHMDILSGYVDEKSLQDLLAYMQCIDELKDAKNNLLEHLRTATKKELYTVLSELDQEHDKYPEVKKWIKEELNARTLLGRIRAAF